MSTLKALPMRYTLVIDAWPQEGAWSVMVQEHGDVMTFHAKAPGLVNALEMALEMAGVVGVE